MTKSGSKLREENPFSPTFPVNPKYFVNREHIISSFRRSFERSTKTEMPTPDNIAILGDPGMGKTSLLRKFEAIALEEFKERKTFSAIVEFTPDSCGSFTSIFRKIVDDISGNFVTQTPVLKEIRNEIKDWRIKSIGRGARIGLKKKTKDEPLMMLVRKALVDLWKILEKQGVDIALLMLDDMHYVANKYPDALNGMRGVFQWLPKHGCNFMLCITGKKELFSDAKRFAEPFVNFFNIKHILKPLTLNETRDAILKPLNLLNLDMAVEEGVIEKIYGLTMGSPTFINFMMRELVSLKREGRITLRYFEENYPAIERSMEKDSFRSGFSIASDKEKKILLAMAKLPDRFSPSEIDIKNARTQLRFLLRKGLILKHGRGKYSLYHPLFKGYLRSL